AESWDRAAKSAAATLSKRGLAVNEHEPVTVVVKVETSQRYPAGTDKRIDVKPVCANEVIEQIADALQDPASAGKGPVAEDDKRQKFCIPVGIGGKVDPSNLGTHLQTIVHASYSVVRGGDVALPSSAAMPLEDRAPWLGSRADRTERPDREWKGDRPKKK